MSRMICYLAALTVFTLCLSASVEAQNGRASEHTLERYSPESLVMSTPAGTSRFRLATQHVLVRFEDHVDDQQQSELLREIEILSPEQATTDLVFADVVLANLREGTSEQEVVDFLQRIASMPGVRYAHPFLEYGDGTLLGIQDRLHVQLQGGSDVASLESFLRAHDAMVVGADRYSPDLYTIRMLPDSRSNAFEFARTLQESGMVRWAEPDFVRLLERMNTNDPYVRDQWALNNTGSASQYNGTPGADMDVFAAWGITTGSSSVRVAIIDEGVDMAHPDLAANIAAGYDAMGLGSGGNPQGNDAHGTACAGIIAAVGNNATGVVGVAYNSRIVAVRVAYGVGPYWATSDAILADGINWAWSSGSADVLSNSWGGGSPSMVLNTAIDNALQYGRGGRGASVLFSAGNGNSYVKYPASYNATIAVAATSMCDTRKTPTSCDGEYWWGSDYGTNLDIAAPGVKIYTTDISGAAGYRTGDYMPTFNGTSSACPNAAGVMALIYAVNPALTHAQARQILETTTEKVGGYTYTNNVPGQPNGSWSTDLGYGRVNANQAVNQAITSLCWTDTSPPTIVAPSDLTLPTSPGQCSVDAALVNLGKPTVTDNCPHTVVVTNDAPPFFPAGTTTVTWTATDGGNNSVSAVQYVTVVDVEPPQIITCASDASVEGDAQNEAQLPDFTGQVLASDNCTAAAALIVAQSHAPNTVLATGTHVITFTVTDGEGLSATCTSLFTVVPRTEVAPEAQLVVVSGACKYPVVVTRSVRIDNSGGNFGNGMMLWTASTTAPEITLVSSSGAEGDNLVFTVDPRYLSTGTIVRDIIITAYNSATMADAINSPFTLVVSIQIEPGGAVTVTQPVGTSWTPFLNNSGHKVAEVKSNTGPITSFTVNAVTCAYPQGLSRIRYVRRYFTLASNASTPNVDVRFYYTNTEAMPLVSVPSALTVWHRPWNRWVNIGGSSVPLQNYVEFTGLRDVSGQFALAHNWFPKNTTADMVLPGRPQISQNYPNPFNPSTTISYVLPRAQHVRLSVHDLYGREIAVLVDTERGAGNHDVIFDASDLPSGSYLCVMVAGGEVVTRSMTLLK